MRQQNKSKFNSIFDEIKHLNKLSDSFIKCFFHTKNGLIKVLEEFLNDRSKNNLIITSKHLSKYSSDLPLRQKFFDYEEYSKCKDKKRITCVRIPKYNLIDAINDNLFQSSIITTLDLRSENDNLNEIDLSLLFDALKCNEKITSLDLSYNHFGLSEFKLINNFLKYNQSIKHINLQCSSNNNESIDILADALKCNNHIESLNLSYNEIKYLSKILTVLKTNKKIHTLNLSGIFGYDSDEKHIELVTDLIKTNNCIKLLDISNNGMENMSLILDSLKTNTSINYINLYDSDIHNYINELADILIVNNNITYINLGRNSIPSEKLVILCNSLKKNKTIKYLCLVANKIDNKEISILIDMLEINHTIKKINLDHNDIDYDGFILLAKAIKKIKRSVYISLKENGIILTDEEKNNIYKILGKRKYLIQF